MSRALWVWVLSVLGLLAVPVGAQAANVTVSGGAITYNAGAGETNTAVIAKQQTTAVATIYFVGDQNPDVTVTASAAQGCLPTPPASACPRGTSAPSPLVTPVNSLVENLGDGNDTGVINSGSRRPAGHDQRRYRQRHPGRRPGERHLHGGWRDRQRRLRRHLGRRHQPHGRGHRDAAGGRLADHRQRPGGRERHHRRRRRGPDRRQRQRHPDRQRRAEHDRRLRASRHARRRSPARRAPRAATRSAAGVATTRCSPATAAR